MPTLATNSRSARKRAIIRRFQVFSDRKRSTRVGRWLVAALVVGLALRVGWYVANPCVWGDEGWLILNVLNKSFAELTGPLNNHQAAPPVFLWAVKACSVWLGEGTHALRLVPFLASCVGFVLMAAVGGRFPRTAVLPAVVLLAGSSKMLGHTAEVKPYTFDFCVAAAVAVWFCRSSKRPGRRLLEAGLLCPAVVLLTYTGCFLAGAVLLGLAARAIERRRWREFVPLAVIGIVTLGAFALLLTGPGAAQQTSALRGYWMSLGHFPDWSRPWSLPGWLLTGIGGIFRYCCYPLGTALVPLGIVGFVALWRSGRREVAVFLAAPLALAAVAGLLGRYPFGGSRLHFYAAPGVALLIAAGVRDLWDRLGRLRELWPQWVSVARAALVAVVCWGLVEGATFPLLFEARTEYRPAAAFLSQRADRDPILCGDPVLDYYFAGRERTHHPATMFDLHAERMWLVPDPKAPDPVAQSGSFCGRPVIEKHQFGSVVVYRLGPARR